MVEEGVFTGWEHWRQSRLEVGREGDMLCFRWAKSEVSSRQIDNGSRALRKLRANKEDLLFVSAWTLRVQYGSHYPHLSMEHLECGPIKMCYIKKYILGFKEIYMKMKCRISLLIFILNG